MAFRKRFRRGGFRKRGFVKRGRRRRSFKLVSRGGIRL